MMLKLRMWAASMDAKAATKVKPRRGAAMSGEDTVGTPGGKG
jgi:hypothetical protein